LVVIAIIALLAAILFPVFARARENARRASCQSNMKQLGLGMAQYIQDYDGTFPTGFTNDTGKPDYSGIGWAEKIYPYVKNAQVYVCPDEDLKAKFDSLASGLKFNRVSYGINANFTEPTTDNNTFSGGKESALNMPSKTVMLFEAAMAGDFLTFPRPPQDAGFNSHDFGSPAGWGDASGFRSVAQHASGFAATGRMGGCLVTNCPTYTSNVIGTATGQGFYSVTGRHFDGANFLMADGHVKWLKGDQVSVGRAASKANGPLSSTAPESSYRAGGYYNAQGTEYSGPDARAVTFNTN
jgi:prepilin-type processing-associated H-X9-DG protein